MIFLGSLSAYQISWFQYLSLLFHCLCKDCHHLYWSIDVWIRQFCHWNPQKTISCYDLFHGCMLINGLHDWASCGVFKSLFFWLILIPQYRPCPTMYYWVVDARRTSHSCLRTWEITNRYVRKIDQMVVTSLLLVMGCWWSYSHISTYKRHVKHSRS